MDENISGADLEEAHLYHTIREFSYLVDKYGWEYIQNKLEEIYSVETMA